MGLMYHPTPSWLGQRWQAESFPLAAGLITYSSGVGGILLNVVNGYQHLGPDVVGFYWSGTKQGYSLSGSIKVQ